jgi:hypothetical protein
VVPAWVFCIGPTVTSVGGELPCPLCNASVFKVMGYVIVLDKVEIMDEKWLRDLKTICLTPNCK